MEYSKILEELDKASLFELYRLNQAIWKQLEDPNRNQLVKRQLRIGQDITYFEADENRLIEATIIDVKRTRASVRNKHDGRIWNIPFYHINIDKTDTDIKPSQNKVDRNSLKIGDTVCFTDKQGDEIFGQVTKLNPKTAGVLVGNVRWRVAYGFLSSVLDGQVDTNLFLEGEVEVFPDS